MGRSRFVKYWVLSPFLLPHLLLYLMSKNKKVIEEDIKRWIDCTVKESHGIHLDLLYLLTFWIEYRNIFYLRIGRWSYLLRWYIRPLSTLYINTPSDRLGAGFFIQHGFSTVITADRIGRNCWINQQVTIGYNESKKNGYGKPIIEDNVRISCGAKVVGSITVGTGSVIGVNAVVVKDIPPHSVVVPSPMLIKCENENTFKRL